MSEWKCCMCDKEFTFDEYIALSGSPPKCDGMRGKCDGTFLEDKRRILKQEYVTHNHKRYWISTVDLCMNHGFGKDKLWYETMIFNKGMIEEYMSRYATRQQAKEGHMKAIDTILNGDLDGN